MATDDTQQKPQPQASQDKESVTCKHCRYDYPAHLERCSVCGYPWPWMKPEGKRS